MSKVAYRRRRLYGTWSVVSWAPVPYGVVALCALSLCAGCSGRNDEGASRKQALSKLALVTSEEALDGETFRVGVLYPIPAASGFQQPFRDLIQRTADANSLHLEVETTSTTTSALEQAAAHLAERNVQAILVCGIADTQAITHITRAKNTPVFVIPADEENEPLLPGMPGVTQITRDDADAGRLAGEQLAHWLPNTGNMVIIGGAQDAATARRLNAMMATLTRKKSRIKIERLPDLPDIHQEAARLQQLLQRKESEVNALAVANPLANDSLTEALRIARRNNVAVCRVYSRPNALTEVQGIQRKATVSAPGTSEIGKIAMETIAATLRGEKTPREVLVRPLLTLEARSNDTPTLIPTGFHPTPEPSGKKH